jgi:uncharacterized repeat protein (TIGR04052 family)
MRRRLADCPADARGAEALLSGARHGAGPSRGRLPRSGAMGLRLALLLSASCGLREPGLEVSLALEVRALPPGAAVTVQPAWLSILELRAVPCESTARRWLRRLSPLNVAWAHGGEHADSGASPWVLTLQEPLALDTSRTLALGVLQPPPGTWCSLEVTVGPSPSSGAQGGTSLLLGSSRGAATHRYLSAERLTVTLPLGTPSEARAHPHAQARRRQRLRRPRPLEPRALLRSPRSATVHPHRPGNPMNLRLAALTLLLAACGGAGPASDAGAPPDAGADPGVPVTALAFKAKVGSADFACGQTYSVGSPATQYQPRDFRFYVHEVTLTTEQGTEVPFTLTDDGSFQGDGVALLDFEDNTGACKGTPETHATLRGLAPAGRYTAVSFTLGVPFAKNHQDAAAASPPLNATAMFWNWQGGYKFLKVDSVTTGLTAGHNLHLGSTGCQPGPTPNSVASCDNPNRVKVTLEGFSPGKAIVLDLAALVAASNLDVNQPMSAPGCMSSPTDLDCAPVFARLGLPFGSSAAVPQVAFKLE